MELHKKKIINDTIFQGKSILFFLFLLKWSY